MQVRNENKLDAAIAVQRLPVQGNICQSRPDREKLRAEIRSYIARENLIPPLSLDELSPTCRQGFGAYRISRSISGLTPPFLIHNELWAQRVSDIPYDRRLLLLPRCLRNSEVCQAQEDSLGLICAKCGNCAIHDLQITTPSNLGTWSWWRRGSPRRDGADRIGENRNRPSASAVFPVLERVFPYMEAAAVPGIAIPLLRDGCADTYADMDWVWEAIYLNSEKPIPRMDLNGPEIRRTKLF